MDWRRLERWATISFGIAAGLAVIIQLTKRLAPEGWLLQRLAQDTVDYLDELGDIGGGLILLVFLSILGGSGVMTVLLRGIEKLHEMREKSKNLKEERKKLREEAIAEGREQGITEGREQGITEGRMQARADFRARLKEMGYDPEEILPPEERESQSDPGNGE